MKAKKTFVTTAVATEEVEKKAPKNEKEYQEAYHELRRENEDFKNIISQRDTRIRVLEVELEGLKAQLEDLKVAKTEFVPAQMLDVTTTLSSPLRSPSSEVPPAMKVETIGTINSETTEDGHMEVTVGNATAEFFDNGKD